MTIEEFGKQIKTKYPQYSDMTDGDIGQKMLTKYPQYNDMINKNPEIADTFLKGHGILKGISDLVGATGLGKGIAQGIFLRFTPEGKDVMKRIESGEMKYSDLENIIGKGVTNKEIIGGGVQTGTSLLAFGGTPLSAGKTIVRQGTKTFLKTARSQALKAGTITGIGGAANEYAKGGSTGDVISSGLKSAATGAVISGGISAIKGGLSQIPKLLSYTSNIPGEALNYQFTNPSKVASASRSLSKNGINELYAVQKHVFRMRSDLNDYYKEGVDSVINEFTNKRISLASKTRLLNKVADIFGIDLPQNIRILSVKESLGLYKTINELASKGSIAKSSEGYIVRELRSFLRDSIVSRFGGEGGSVDRLLKNYSAEKQTLDAIAALTNAFKNKDVVKQNAALNMLKNVFSENKAAYLNAVQDFQTKTGFDILSSASAMQTSKLLPTRTGGLGLDELFRMALFPLTSPKVVGIETRALGGLTNSGGTQTQSLIKGVLRRMQTQ